MMYFHAIILHECRLIEPTIQLFISVKANAIINVFTIFIVRDINMHVSHNQIVKMATCFVHCLNTRVKRCRL